MRNRRIDSCSQPFLFLENQSTSNLLPVLRPVHYLGSKLRITREICEIIDILDPSYGPVCDLFAGSGTVSKALSQKRDVIAVDIQEYSRVLCSALLHPCRCDENTVEEFVAKILSSEQLKILSLALKPLVDFESECLESAKAGNLEPLCDFLENGSLVALEHNTCHSSNPDLLAVMKEVESRLAKADLVNNSKSLVTRYFGGIYFGYSQTCHLDAILDAISSIQLERRDTFLAATLSTASEIVNTIGKQFAQPLRPRYKGGKPKPHLFELVSRDRTSIVLDIYKNWLKRYSMIKSTERPHMVIKDDYQHALKELKRKVQVVYADPPYTRDHYSRYYHVLETICLRDNPTISTVRINGKDLMSRGIYRADRYQSPFCIHSKAPEAFSSLFSNVRALDVPLVLSYSPFSDKDNSRPRLMTIKQIEELAKVYFRHVEISQAGHISHSKLTSVDKTFGISYDAEVLFICQP